VALPAALAATITDLPLSFDVADTLLPLLVHLVCLLLLLQLLLLLLVSLLLLLKMWVPATGVPLLIRLRIHGRRLPEVVHVLVGSRVQCGGAFDEDELNSVPRVDRGSVSNGRHVLIRWPA